MQDHSRRLLTLAVNSTAAYLIAYLFFYNFYSLAMASVGNALGFDAQITHIGVLVQPEDQTWYQYVRTHEGQHIIYTFASGSFACLLVGIFCKFLHFNIYKKKRGIAKLLLQWGFLHGWVFFFGGAAVGSIVKTSLGLVLYWLRVPEIGINIIAALCLFMVILIGFISTRTFLQMANSHSMVANHYMNRVWYIFAIAIVPWLIANGLMYVVRIPENHIFDLYMWLMMLILLIPTITFARAVKGITLPKDREELRYNWPVIIGALAFVVLYRVSLDTPIHFEGTKSGVIKPLEVH